MISRKYNRLLISPSQIPTKLYFILGFTGFFRLVLSYTGSTGVFPTYIFINQPFHFALIRKIGSFYSCGGENKTALIEKIKWLSYKTQTEEIDGEAVYTVSA